MDRKYFECRCNRYCEQYPPEAHHFTKGHHHNYCQERIEVHRLLEDQRFDQVSLKKIDDGERADYLEDYGALLKLDICKKKAGGVSPELPR
jgi:hypothetical protein